MNNTALKPAKKGAKLRKSLKRIQALYSKNRLKEAKPLCDWVFSQNIHNPDFLHMYGLILRACGDPNDALVKIFAAHEQLPSDARILNSLGLVFLDMNDVETAITMFKRATTADEKYYDAWGNLGLSLRKAERYNAAELAFKCAYFLDRSKPGPLFDVALMQVDVRRYGRAAEIMDELLDAHENITAGMRLKRLQIAMRLEDLDYVKEHKGSFDRSELTLDEQSDLDAVIAQYHMIFDEFDEAIAVLEQTSKMAVAYQIDHLTHLGFCYGLAGRIDEGIATLERMLEIYPDNAPGRHNLALLQYKKGDLEGGHKNYDARWDLPEFSSKRRKFDIPAWRGEPLNGKNILVWREQGIGDEVRYASLLPELQELGGTITFECTPKLIPLWEQTFPWAEIAPEGKELCINEPEYERFDYQVPVGSLGAVFRNSLTDFAEKQAPWIARDHTTEMRIREQLAIQPHELLVGVCWRSMNQIASRDKVYLNCEQLAPFKALPDTRWLNVQYASTPEEIQQIRECGLDLHHYEDLDQMNDLVGACNLLGACDVVISVGGSVGDLAGGIGTPLIYMTRELSEAFLGTDHVPWFPKCKSYPIKAYKADETVERVVNDWPVIAEWAEGLKSSDRKSGAPANGNSTSPALDLEYSVVREET